MEEVELAAVVVTRDSAALVDGTLEALEAALADVPGARRLVVDADSSDDTAARAARRGWAVVRLDPAGAITPSASREAGRRAAGARHVLFVDGDVCVEPGFLPAARARLAAEPGLAGVGGELRFDEGHGAPPRGPGGEARVPHLAALALYRADALERVGGFVPWLESEEDADLGLRLRAAGYALVRLRPGGVHRSGPRGGLAETLRRWRAGLYFGQGRVLRLRWGSPLFGATLARNRLYLGVLGAWIGCGLLAPVWPPAAGLLPLGVLAALFAMALRKRSLYRAWVSVATWHVMAVGLLAGLVLEPRSREVRVRPGAGGA